MDTNKLKRFAGEARNILIDGVKQRLSALGIREDGTIEEKPELKDGGAVFMGDTQTVDFYDQFESLSNQLKNHSYCDVIEEVAYTWFNRLVAIRIMAKNGLIPPVLEYESEQDRIPVLVSDARQGRMPQMNEESRQKLEVLLANDALTDEQFQVLIVAYCHNNPVINKCFGTISDYTELLLPGNILKKDGFIDRLNDDDYISDNDYKSPELIGWLYQFYISERKDEVFAKKGKFEADEIPAATQIFTPNWIVKYMVQNTVGRIYLDNNPYSDIKKGMQYLVEPAEPTPADAIYHFDDIHDLTCADLACGSGHILNECFDLLYQIYIEEGYNREKAIENIFRYNLTGVDIDTRAKQLATFALMIKACQKDNSFIDAHVLPRVLTMPQTYDEEENGSITNFISQFFQGSETKQITSELVDAFNLMKDASSLGSIMKFTISESTRYVLAQTVDYWKQQSFVPKSIQNNMPGMELILSLTQKYSVLVMNPPYMKAANMNDILKEYVVKHYENGALDLYSVFMYFAMQNILKHGKISMIVQPTWLVNSSFGVMRNYILDNFGINSLLHMGRGNFGNDWGSIAFTLSEGEQNPNTMFFKLYERTFYRIETEHISSLFLAAKTKIEFRYPFSQYSSIHFSLGTGNEGQRICYMCPKNKFRRLKNSPFCYTFSDDIINIIKKTNISSSFSPATGLQTGNNTKFIRTWFETSNSDLRIKWFPLVNGGNFRKWYGNLTDIIYWNEDGKDIKNCKSSVLRNKQFYQKSGITWNRIASKGITIRAFPSGCLFDQAGDSMFCNDIDKLYTCMSYLNTKVAKIFFDMLAPTINLTAGMIGQLPYIDKESNCCLKITKENIDISKQDWDAHETSWDFQENELVRLKDEGFYSKVTIENEPIDIGITLCELCLHYKMQWEAKFNKLHVNEEELNREFIEIYGLQDELTPDVPLDEITILQQGEISIEDNQIVWHDDVLMKQLISYAVGCIMGRYSIDKPGLILANQGDGLKEYETLVPNSRFEIDDDGIIPIMPANTEFTDNITLRFKTWLSTVFGENSLIENLNYIEKSLGKRLDDYFVKDFWKYHKKMYQNRPIYWLFSSKKGAFQCIVYMHRMNAYTAEKVRTNYLLPHIEWLINKQSEMQANAADLSIRERKEMDNIGKQIEECREYHDRLHAIADKQIAFDLDDGVVVNYAKFEDVLMKLK